MEPSAFRSTARVATAAGVAACALAGGGCVVGELIGGAAESFRLTGSTTFPAEYEGLSGRSFAVYVAADRVVQASNPALLARVSSGVNGALAEHAGGSAHIPTQTMLNAQLNNPQWLFMPRDELAEQLGVERLVVVEIVDYRLFEAGNAYIWDGFAEAIVEVYETDGLIPDEPVYDRTISVRYPDATGVLREEVPENLVTSELSRRLTQRVAWLFYEHEEPNAIRY